MVVNKTKSGFTLVELITVMAIIGLLATVTLKGLNGSRERSRDAVRAGDMKTLSQAVESYFSEHFVFPENLNDVSTYFAGGALPHDPVPERSYLYLKLTNPKGYCLGAMMEQSANGNNVTCGLETNSSINYQVKGP